MSRAAEVEARTPGGVVGRHREFGTVLTGRSSRSLLSRLRRPFAFSVNRLNRLEAEFWRSVGEHRVWLAYQPKLDMREGSVAGLEGLLRWHHPARGPVSPAEFIPAFEAAGKLGEITGWILDRAIADQRFLAEQGWPLPIAINVPGYLLSDTGFARQLATQLAGLAAPIGIEITETSIIANTAAAQRHLRDLAADGLVIAIDDYGAGLSSLSYLRDFPAHELKIDRTFITDLTSCHRNPLIVRSTIDLAHALGMTVVAEGVESLEALSLLRVMGCDMAQGFAIARPQPVAGIVNLLDSGALPLRLDEAAAQARTLKVMVGARSPGRLVAVTP